MWSAHWPPAHSLRPVLPQPPAANLQGVSQKGNRVLCLLGLHWTARAGQLDTGEPAALRAGHPADP